MVRENKGHTPGPWRYDGSNLVGKNGKRVLFSGHIGLAIAPLPKDNPNDLLLLAAPDLLAIVQSLATFDARNSIVHLREMARAALANLTPTGE